MNGDTDTSERNNHQRLAVTSVGNAWVVCDSKSRPGYKYYFNTLSGQAVWNLSPDEIEKATKFTRQLPISEIEKCPEPPTDPPMDTPMNSAQAASLRAFLNQTVRGQHPNQMPNRASNPMPNQLPNLKPNPISNLMPNPISNLMPNQIPNQPNQIPNGFPMNLLTNMPGFPAISGLNPFIWSNAPSNAVQTQPIIYVVPQPPLNFQPKQEHPQNLPAHIYQNSNNRKDDDFKNTNNHDTNIMNDRNSMFNKEARHIFSHRNETRARNLPHSQKDLRHKLRRKRSQSVSNESTSLFNCGEDEDTFRNVHTRNEKMNEADEEVSKYNLSVLQKLKPASSNKRNWFIIVDTEILLGNFPFLNKITDPDQNCHLLVPDHVMCELREIVRNSSDMPTRRILRFLTQQIETGYAFKGDKICNVEDDGFKMFATCQEQAIHHNVILLSNDDNSNRFKGVHKNIHVFTLKEFKQFLNDANIYSKSNSPTLGIKIEVPNDSSQANVKPNTEIKPPVRYRWRKQRDKTPKTAPKPQSSVQVANRASIEQQETTNLGDSGIVMQENNLPLLPTRAPSIDRSSISSQQKGTLRPSIIIEETSNTSGIISNTTLDSVSLNINIPTAVKQIINESENNNKVNFVKFQVVGQGMEEVLRTRREEWMLRFVQIMEETLREILRDTSQFENKGCDYTPSWATDLLNLSRCITIKYIKHFKVVDASNKLSNTLETISNRKGNISATIEPTEFMDMYSNGVYLIDELKRVSENCEDIKTAEDSLKKLLYDIQNANQECNHNDTFADEMNETANNVVQPTNSEKPPLHEFSDGVVQIGVENHNDRNVNKGHTFSPRKDNPTQINKDLQQRPLSTIEAKFFSSLALSKRPNTDKTPLTLDVPNAPNKTPDSAKLTETPAAVSPSRITPITSPRNQLNTNFNAVEENPVDNSKETSKSKNDLNTNINKDNEKTSSPVEPCIVRKFSSIAQFEEKLNRQTAHAVHCSRFSSLVHTNDTDAIDDNANSEDLFYEYDEHGAEYYDQDDDYYVDDNEFAAGEQERPDNGEFDSELEDLPHTNIHSDKDRRDGDDIFECLTSQITGEILIILKAAQKLCVAVAEELKNSRKPSSDMREKLKKMTATLSSYLPQLDSILARDSKTSKCNMIDLLKKANLESYITSVSEESLSQYTDVIKECRKNIDMWNRLIVQTMKTAGMEEVI